MACDYLAGKGYKILDRNVYLMRKELDIVAMEGDTIVLVEVKRRRPVVAATAYLKRRRLLERPCRFDVMAVRLKADGMPSIEHIKNAFEAGG
jgi:putative endonuclease